jgi:hypothetical protein
MWSKNIFISKTKFASAVSLFSFPTRGSHHATSSSSFPLQILDLWKLTADAPPIHLPPDPPRRPTVTAAWHSWTRRPRARCSTRSPPRVGRRSGRLLHLHLLRLQVLQLVGARRTPEQPQVRARPRQMPPGARCCLAREQGDRQRGWRGEKACWRCRQCRRCWS